MVNYVCQLGWAKGSSIAGKTYFWVYLVGGGLWKRLAFKSIHGAKKIILINVHGHHLTHSSTGWNKKAEGG